MKKGYHSNVENLTRENTTNFRQVLYTGRHMQLVLMSISVGGEIGTRNSQRQRSVF